MIINVQLSEVERVVIRQLIEAFITQHEMTETLYNSLIVIEEKLFPEYKAKPDEVVKPKLIVDPSTDESQVDIKP